MTLTTRTESLARTGPLSHAVASLRAGRPVLVADAVDRENEYDVVLSAALAEPRWVAWAVRHTSGLLCAPLPADRADELDLRPMALRNEDPRGTAYTVSVDAANGVGTGISAADRARTARVLADPASRPGDLVRPGHLLPLRARAGGVVERPGHTEAGVDLCRLAGLPPVALIAEVVSETAMAGAPEAHLLAARYDVPVLDLAELVDHRLRHGDGERGRVTRVVTTRLPTTRGVFDAVGFRDEVTGAEHLALLGRRSATRPPVALHSECPLGDILGSLACGCARQLDEALDTVAFKGGILVYLRHPGKQAVGATNEHVWTTADDGAAAAILVELGHTAVHLLSGPTTSARLARSGLVAVDIPHRPPFPSPRELLHLANRHETSHDVGRPVPNNPTSWASRR